MKADVIFANHVVIATVVNNTKLMEDLYYE